MTEIFIHLSSHETFFEWVGNLFNPWLEENEIPKPVILFSDWHETRNNYFTAKLMDKYQIVMMGKLA